jgi:hypothetical protein
MTGLELTYLVNTNVEITSILNIQTLLHSDCRTALSTSTVILAFNHSLCGANFPHSFELSYHAHTAQMQQEIGTRARTAQQATQCATLVRAAVAGKKRFRTGHAPFAVYNLYGIARFDSYVIPTVAAPTLEMSAERN